MLESPVHGMLQLLSSGCNSDGRLSAQKQYMPEIRAAATEHTPPRQTSAGGQQSSTPRVKFCMQKKTFHVRTRILVLPLATDRLTRRRYEVVGVIMAGRQREVTKASVLAVAALIGGWR